MKSSIDEVCITSKEKHAVLYHLELKALELRGCMYTKTVVQTRRQIQIEPEPSVD